MPERHRCAGEASGEVSPFQIVARKRKGAPAVNNCGMSVARLLWQPRLRYRHSMPMSAATMRSRLTA